MKVVFNFLIVSLMFFMSIGNSNSQDKPKDDPKWPNIALHNSKIKYNLQSTNGDKNTYLVIVSLEVINFGEKKTSVNKLNLKLTLGAGVGSVTEYYNTFNKVFAIQALNQDQRQSVEWKFTYTTLGNLWCHDFLATVVNKVPMELVIDNNKLVNKTNCNNVYLLP